MLIHIKTIWIFLIFILVRFHAFAQVNLTSSNLPIIVIKTDEQEIPDEPKITAKMGIIYNGNGERNQMDDPFNEYDGYIGIEKRGSSSLALFPKVGYGIETRLENGENNNVELLGLPKENDWILHGPYSDKSLMRNALAYKISGLLMDYAPRVRFCEVVLNGEYLGIYIFTEKIKRDNDRVNISKLAPETKSGDALTGGYIIKFDKFDGAFNDGWESAYSSLANQEKFPIFQYHYPKPHEITAPQKEYIQSFIKAFEDALAAPDFKNPEKGYRQYIEVSTFIDFMLINEVTKNVDAYRLSSFMYKDRDSIDSRLKAGPIWDFNLAFGNANYCRGGDRQGWAWSFNNYCPDDFWVVHFWWARFRQDEAFLDETYERWLELRATSLKTEKLMACIDSMSHLLVEAQARNFQKWNILNEPIWPNAFVGGSYQAEVNYLKEWLNSRLNWLDANLKRLVQNPYEPANFFEPFAYPNPSTHFIVFDYYAQQSETVRIEIYDVHGQLIVQLLDADHPNNKNSLIWEHDLSVGLYFYRIWIGEEVMPLGKFIIH